MATAQTSTQQTLEVFGIVNKWLHVFKFSWVLLLLLGSVVAIKATYSYGQMTDITPAATSLISGTYVVTGTSYYGVLYQDLIDIEDISLVKGLY
ncbi:MAG: hypothetical protein JNK86_04295 [Alphaproteobacteria bacterium]|nr:hypothetical protein [Alphaproteobacteria bacterium]